ncbi:hypothetical protein NGM99_00640 [Mesorhizobium sp. RP14(2022)]|jgi:hypothetical protein|uniref:Transcriptional regulator n=1 Tax=Mesorhizobium liriopis TaxID=2953882 RepID=A0ABT1C0E2_9HYPH|nr:hypothetical protein [Mesorhizobium liriopis]MCO6048297.1 hypothetical protein [Mesorhizobium liriopis]
MADYSDKGLSILAFAAYHSLTSGSTVSEVVLDDGEGHRADPDGVKELEDAGLLQADGARGRLSSEGEAALGKVLDAIRGAVR